MIVEPAYKEIGALLMQARLERGLSQADVADLLGLQRSSVSNIEVGRQRIMLHTLIGIAAILEVSPGSLLDRAISQVKTSRKRKSTAS